MRFQDQTIVITGASMGIGRALAIALAARGAKLALAARSAEALAETVQLCEAAGGTAIAVPTDITEPTACQALIQQTIQTFGQLDCLVNNAALSMIAPFEQVQDLSAFEQVMRVNYLGAVACTYYALPHLKASQGLVVAISSLCGKTGIPTRSAYVASKHALQGFFDTLRIELRGTGVAVLVVSPGFVATGIRQRALNSQGQPWGDSPRDESRNTQSIAACVSQIVRGMERRQREVITTPKGQLLTWIKLVAPDLVDWLAVQATLPLSPRRS
ncbi:SDR family oxidoreductase [Trichothermofontia sichuanensis B231]|uniref:SDR family oxidoreductase n=1 Tax=Trichothermofontia sichuanensis TaxID=3045816 RepID=UPI0022480C1C|nr:SDR family oxidoreductase [Trichothermofontia sichuanensis]UZQ53416.1 SDR family oxidoreductase [Trichothermofontia sichuanensis B231]